MQMYVVCGRKRVKEEANGPRERERDVITSFVHTSKSALNTVASPHLCIITRAPSLLPPLLPPSTFPLGKQSPCAFHKHPTTTTVSMSLPEEKAGGAVFALPNVIECLGYDKNIKSCYNNQYIAHPFSLPPFSPPFPSLSCPTLPLLTLKRLPFSHFYIY